MIGKALFWLDEFSLIADYNQFIGAVAMYAVDNIEFSKRQIDFKLEWQDDNRYCFNFIEIDELCFLLCKMKCHST